MVSGELSLKLTQWISYLVLKSPTFLVKHSTFQSENPTCFSIFPGEASIFLGVYKSQGPQQGRPGDSGGASAGGAASGPGASGRAARGAAADPLRRPRGGGAHLGTRHVSGGAS